MFFLLPTFRSRIAEIRGPCHLRLLIVRYCADVEQVVVNGITLHFADESRQEVKTDVRRNPFRDPFEKL